MVTGYTSFLESLDYYLAEMCLSVPETHGSEDVIEVVGGEEVLLLDVEEVEAELEHLDLVHLERRRLCDLVEVDVRKLQ